MKPFFTFGVIVALCQSVYSIAPGDYPFRPAKDIGLFMTSYENSLTLEFDPGFDEATQLWTFEPLDEDWMSIQSKQGGYLNCKEGKGSPCFLDQAPEGFRLKSLGPETYALVHQRTQQFLHFTRGATLELTKKHRTPYEEFIVAPL